MESNFFLTYKKNGAGCTRKFQNNANTKLLKC